MDALVNFTTCFRKSAPDMHLVFSSLRLYALSNGRQKWLAVVIAIMSAGPIVINAVCSVFEILYSLTHPTKQTVLGLWVSVEFNPVEGCDPKIFTPPTINIM